MARSSRREGFVVAFLARRLLGMIPIVIGASLIVFIVGRLAPGDPVQMLFGDISDPVIDARARAHLGLDKPLAVQYLRFLAALGRLDLGTSYAYPGMHIDKMLGEALPVSLELALLSVLAAVVVGVPLGVLAATRPHSLLDRGV